MVEFMAKAILEEGTWAERWGWGGRWYLRFCHDGVGNAGELNASLSASVSASAEDDKCHSES